jgi:hypothetical protein
MTILRIFKVHVGDSRDLLKARVIYGEHNGRHVLRASFGKKTLTHRFNKPPRRVHLQTVADECSLIP